MTSVTADTTPRIVILSCLDGLGPTGVDTHMRTAARMAQEAGYFVQILHPNHARTALLLFVKVIYRLAKACHATELSARIARLGQALALRAQLRRALRAPNAGPITIYAQDSVSCVVAGEIRGRSSARIVTAVHFNRSEAEEMTAKGLTRAGGKLYRSAQALERRSIATADCILFVSNFVRAEVLSRYGNDVFSKSRLITLSPESEISPTDAKASADLIAIGTLEPRKNQEFLLQILRACKDLGRDYTLTIVGDGPDRSRLEQRVEYLGLNDQVTFLGRVRQGHELIPSHRALIHGAENETLGLVLIEALAYGRPVIAPPIGGIPEIMRDNCEGIFIYHDDVFESAKRVVEFLEDKDRLQNAKLAARDRYEKAFSRSAAKSQLLNALLGVSTS